MKKLYKAKYVLGFVLLLLFATLFVSNSEAWWWKNEDNKPSPHIQSAGFLNYARKDHTASLLDNGKVFIMGGGSRMGQCAQATAELYDPETSTFTDIGTMHFRRKGHTATKLSDGRVVLIGGVGEPFNDSKCRHKYIREIEIYNPTTKKVGIFNKLPIDLKQHTATLLPNNNILIAAAVAPYFINKPENKGKGEIYIYDTNTNTLKDLGLLIQKRKKHQAFLSNDKTKVLLAGGLYYYISKDERAKYIDNIFHPKGCEIIDLKNSKNHYPFPCPTSSEYGTTQDDLGRVWIKYDKRALRIDADFKHAESFTVSELDDGPPDYSDPSYLTTLNNQQLFIFSKQSNYNPPKSSKVLLKPRMFQVYDMEQNKIVLQGKAKYFREKGTTFTKLKNGNILIVGGEEDSKRTYDDYFLIKEATLFTPNI